MTYRKVERKTLGFEEDAWVLEPDGKRAKQANQSVLEILPSRGREKNQHDQQHQRLANNRQNEPGEEKRTQYNAMKISKQIITNLRELFLSDHFILFFALHNTFPTEATSLVTSIIIISHSHSSSSSIVATVIVVAVGMTVRVLFQRQSFKNLATRMN
jgi:hypothetical protein